MSGIHIRRARRKRPFRQILWLLAWSVGFFAVDHAQAGTITFTSLVNPAASTTFGTIPGHGLPPGAVVPNFTWNYSGSYADPRLPALHASFSSHICIGPGGACGSNNNDGVAGNEYAGFEFIYFTFVLPAGATNVKLIFDDFDADDRAALSVNGTLIGGFSSKAAVGGTLVTTMKDGSGNHSVMFNKPLPPTQDAPGLFHPGENFLAFWINNTNSNDVTVPAIAHVAAGDPSDIRLRGGILFDTAAVPAPASLALLAVGLAGFAIAHWRRRA